MFGVRVPKSDARMQDRRVELVWKYPGDLQSSTRSSTSLRRSYGVQAEFGALVEMSSEV